MKLEIVICVTCYFLVTESPNPSRKNGTKININMNMDIQVRKFSRLIKNFKKIYFINPKDSNGVVVVNVTSKDV